MSQGKDLPWLPESAVRTSEGIFHPKGASQYANNAISQEADMNAYQRNQSQDLIDNNSSTGKCKYRYYVLKIPANLGAVGGIDV
jgi:hypothetical protein